MFSLSISLRDGVLCASMKHTCLFFNPADSSEFFPQCFKLAEDSRISRIAAGHEPQHPAPGLQSEVGVCDSEILCNARGEALRVMRGGGGGRGRPAASRFSADECTGWLSY